MNSGEAVGPPNVVIEMVKADCDELLPQLFTFTNKLYLKV